MMENVPSVGGDASVQTDITGPSAPRMSPGILPNPLIDGLLPQCSKRGVLIPLKTTQEVRQDHTIVQAFITRVPTKCANDVIS